MSRAKASPAATAISARPVPPASLFETIGPRFEPAADVVDWIARNILTEGAPLYNEEHKHLQHAFLAVLWTTAHNARQMRRVVGQAEIPAFRCGAWQKGRQEQQLGDWFGGMPDFLITLDAHWCAEASGLEFCALVEHELSHCGHALDYFGNPAFYKDTGLPKFAMKGHDVELFVSQVRRYGIHAAGENAVALLEAAKNAPEISGINIARACGTCNVRSAA